MVNCSVKAAAPEIENDVPMPETPAAKPKATRARKQAASGGKKKKENPAANLLAALKFVSMAQKKTGPINAQFCAISHNWVAASDGVLTVAHPIEEDLSAFPNTLQFIEALSNVENEISITQLSVEALAVSSGAFKGLVSCVDGGCISISAPDPLVATIDDRVKQALAAVVGLTTKADGAAFGSVLLQAGSAVATSGSALLECWHGVDLPPGLLLPAVAAQAIAKQSKTLEGFGFSQDSATFYFEGGAFIKTQLCAEPFPDYLIVMSHFNDARTWALPDEFYKAIRAIQPFSKDGYVFFADDVIYSSVQKENASLYRIEGLPNGTAFNIKELLAVEHVFKQVFFDTDRNRAFFFNETARGILMALEVYKETVDEYIAL